MQNLTYKTMEGNVQMSRPMRGEAGGRVIANLKCTLDAHAHNLAQGVTCGSPAVGGSLTGWRAGGAGGAVGYLGMMNPEGAALIRPPHIGHMGAAAAPKQAHRAAEGARICPRI